MPPIIPPQKLRADRDKDFLISETEVYLQDHSAEAPAVPDLAKCRKEVVDNLQPAKFDITQALKSLEKLRDAKTGIVLHV